MKAHIKYKATLVDDDTVSVEILEQTFRGNEFGRNTKHMPPHRAGFSESRYYSEPGFSLRSVGGPGNYGEGASIYIRGFAHERDTHAINMSLALYAKFKKAVIMYNNGE